MEQLELFPKPKQPSEKQIEKKVSEYAKAKKWLTYKFVSPANRGVPDRIFMREGSVFFIEFKAPGKKPSPLQEHVFKVMRFTGMDVYVIDNIGDGENVIDSH